MNKNDAIFNLINEAVYGDTDSSQHQITLFALVLSIRAKNVLELGVRHGSTAIPLLKALEYTQGHLTSVDIVKNDNLNSLKEQYPNWEYVISDALEYVNNIPENKIYDLVFVDDWHDGEHLYKEIMRLEPHLTTSSLLLVHDCMCYNTQPDYHIYSPQDGEFANGGPFAAIQKLDKSVWEYSTIPVNNGLTILRKIGKTLYF
jgi:predicted O-methyltransferase YrrM